MIYINSLPIVLRPPELALLTFAECYITTHMCLQC
jgi:hypothetical protein